MFRFNFNNKIIGRTNTISIRNITSLIVGYSLPNDLHSFGILFGVGSFTMFYLITAIAFIFTPVLFLIKLPSFIKNREEYVYFTFKDWTISIIFSLLIIIFLVPQIGRMNLVTTGCLSEKPFSVDCYIDGGINLIFLEVSGIICFGIIMRISSIFMGCDQCYHNYKNFNGYEVISD